MAAGDVMQPVGHKGNPDEHAVCKAAKDHVGTDKKGTDVRKNFGIGSK